MKAALEGRVGVDAGVRAATSTRVSAAWRASPRARPACSTGRSSKRRAAQIEQHYPRPVGDRLFRAALFSVAPVSRAGCGVAAGAARDCWAARRSRLLPRGGGLEASCCRDALRALLELAPPVVARGRCFAAQLRRSGRRPSGARRA